MRLVVLRHGLEESPEALHGWLDVPLTDKGVAQAMRAAAYLADVNFKNAYTSDLQRASATAALVAAPHPGLVGAPTPAIRSLNLGLLQGKPYPEIKGKLDDLWGAWRQDDALKAPEGESFAEYQGRVYPFMFRLQQEARHADVLAVTHSHVCDYMGAVAMNGGRPLYGNALDLMKRLEVEPGNALELIEGKISRLNYIR